MRLEGLSAVRLILSPTPNGAITTQVRCSVAASPTGPIATCGAPGPLEVLK